MAPQSSSRMSNQLYTSINGPILLLILTANTFYGFCLVIHRRRFKPPLILLLGCLVVSTEFYCISLVAHYWMLKTQYSLFMLLVSWMIVMHSTHSSMTCYVWLNFYYYIHIVPTQRAIMSWIKKNIMPVILFSVIANTGLLSTGGAIIVMERLCLDFTFNNHTWIGCDNALSITSKTFFIFTQLYVLVCLCIMMVSSFSTAHYLDRHMRSMACSGSRNTAVSLQSQMRVTITGCLQGLLFIIFYAQYLVESSFYLLSSKPFLGVFASFTVSTVYIAITTVNTGMGQIIIRQSVAAVWKALKARLVCGMVTYDVDASPK